MTGQWCADLLTGVRVPQPQRVVVATGDDAGAVGAKGHTGHVAGVAAQRLPEPAPTIRQYGLEKG